MGSAPLQLKLFDVPSKVHPEVCLLGGSRVSQMDKEAELSHQAVHRPLASSASPSWR